MPLPYHLIDGYNLLHAADLARAKYGPGDLERARFALLVRIAEGLGYAEREWTTVVFDAADPPPNARHGFRFREMAVRFAAETGDADALIEDLIRLHASPRQLRVVSDDRRLQSAAKRRGAQAVKSDAFLKRLRRGDGESDDRPAAQPKAATAGDDVAGWLDFFGLPDGGSPIAVPPPDAPEPPAVRTGSAAEAPQSPVPQVRRPAAGTPAPKRPPSGRMPAPAADDVPAEDAAFWQRRIEEMLAEERRRDDRRSQPG